MKKARIFSAISLMLLSICILGVGVYATNSADRYMGISGGVIQVPINLLGVSVKGYIGTDTTKNPADFSSTYTTPQSEKVWELTTKDGNPVLEFDPSEAELASQVSPITLTFVITNESDVALEAYFYDSNDETKGKITQDYLGADNSASNYIIGVSFGSSNIAAATYKEDNSLDRAGTCTIAITFNLNKLLDNEEIVNFSYVLHVAEK